MPMPEEDDNVLDHFRHYEKEKYILKGQNIEEDHIDLISKSLDTRSCVRDILLWHILQHGLLKNKSSLFLNKLKFCEQEFPANTPVFNIKYDYLGLQNNKPFYLLYD